MPSSRPIIGRLLAIAIAAALAIGVGAPTRSSTAPDAWRPVAAQVLEARPRREGTRRVSRRRHQTVVRRSPATTVRRAHAVIAGVWPPGDSGRAVVLRKGSLLI